MISYAIKQIVIGKAFSIEQLSDIQIMHVHNNVLIGFNITAYFLYFVPKCSVNIQDINFNITKVKNMYFI